MEPTTAQALREGCADLIAHSWLAAPPRTTPVPVAGCHPRATPCVALRSRTRPRDCGASPPASSWRCLPVTRTRCDAWSSRPTGRAFSRAVWCARHAPLCPPPAPEQAPVPPYEPLSLAAAEPWCGGGGQDKSARLWDVTHTGEQSRKRHVDWVTAVAFSPDGTRLATSSTVRAQRVPRSSRWAGGRQAQPSGRHQRRPDCAHVAPRRAQDKSARLWSVVTGDQVAQCTGHTAWVRSVVFTPDGTRVATFSDVRAPSPAPVPHWRPERGSPTARFALAPPRQPTPACGAPRLCAASCAGQDGPSMGCNHWRRAGTLRWPQRLDSSLGLQSPERAEPGYL